MCKKKNSDKEIHLETVDPQENKQNDGNEGMDDVVRTKG